MKNFKDGRGREWQIDLNGDTLRRVKELTGADLANVDSGETPVALRLDTDTVFAVDVLYVLVKPQVDALVLTDEDFGRQLAPEGLKAGRLALHEELKAFHTALGRPDQVALLTTHSKFMTRVIARARRWAKPAKRRKRRPKKD